MDLIKNVSDIYFNFCGFNWNVGISFTNLVDLIETFEISIELFVDSFPTKHAKVDLKLKILMWI